MSKYDLPVEDADAILLNRIADPSHFEILPLMAAFKRITYEDIYAQINQPPFNRSPLDGYAVRHEDLHNASEQNPAVLRVTQQIYAGDAPGFLIAPGEAAMIMTGAPLPPGASCVVRQEDTNRGDTVVQIFTSLNEHDNYCFSGEDVSAGQLLISGGTPLNSVRVGILAGQGIEYAKVFRKPRISVLSTGSELTPPGVFLAPGKIYDCNQYTLSLRAQELGAEVVYQQGLPDDLEGLSSAILKALPDSDLIVSTGGVSVGARDYMPLVGERIGANKLFHGINVKPGSPVLALEKDGKLILCLSGNPFAAYATFELLAVPVLRKLAGCRTVHGKRIQGTMVDDFNKTSPGRRFVRARLEGGDVFIPPCRHAAGMLSSLADCNCLIDIPAGNSGLQKGDKVEVILF